MTGHPPGDHPAPLRIRDAVASECNALTALCVRSKASWGYSTHFMVRCAGSLAVTPARIRNWTVRVAESADGTALGVAAVGGDVPGEAELEMLFVDPDAMGTGVGRALVDDAVRILAERGVDVLWIMSDPGAESFYLRQGAVRAGVRPSDAIPGRTLPWLRLAVVPRVPTLHTERLALRPWRDDDLAPFAALNADERVMRYFRSPLDRASSDALATLIRAAFARYGLGLWAVERTDDPARPFIGFIGLSVPRFDAPFTPCVEIGWRLAHAHWGAGLATEGARAAVRHAFDDLRLDDLVSFTAVDNRPSRRVMEKLGMSRDPADDFDYPRLPAGHPLRRHVLYRLHADR